ncbi:protein tramtrack, beta isoform [Culex quinquefasciatus]|uniref:protein tramtrack, beta isoform n=1 Tax=Culex quinquefasciatus TaxID=7176 RepID=UPI0018E3B2ED|nr:protein tramtrack, beta isoform [Culex quinquefasciatus]XP_038119637.1 protein tramtrack, beta isoform [Culex quinquefasciatus]XP_038119638.1 protein tramtrack, beta isoform [Culex quinquefasciatus]XP_038119639.1 protein tramtrack, beta isoform [Culex quinquefasciatus]XP_038119640.1 protein tramtrack, beta isoform [Culex quinquefasciatus]XP_038119641.1 protein tramtrack, beta isoform [Culex quinquefasciatus]
MDTQPHGGGTANGGSPQQFCLRWHNHQTSLLSSLPLLLDQSHLTDVTLIAEGRNIKAHRVVLSACSTFFSELFRTLDGPLYPVIVLPGASFPAVVALLTFMYSGEVNVYEEQISTLLSLAETLGIKGLADFSGNSHKSTTPTTEASSRESEIPSPYQAAIKMESPGEPFFPRPFNFHSPLFPQALNLATNNNSNNSTNNNHNSGGAGTNKSADLFSRFLPQKCDMMANEALWKMNEESEAINRDNKSGTNIGPSGTSLEDRQSVNANNKNNSSTGTGTTAGQASDDEKQQNTPKNETESANTSPKFNFDTNHLHHDSTAPSTPSSNPDEHRMHQQQSSLNTCSTKKSASQENKRKKIDKIAENLRTQTTASAATAAAAAAAAAASFNKHLLQSLKSFPPSSQSLSQLHLFSKPPTATPVSSNQQPSFLAHHFLTNESASKTPENLILESVHPSPGTGALNHAITSPGAASSSTCSSSTTITPSMAMDLVGASGMLKAAAHHLSPQQQQQQQQQQKPPTKLYATCFICNKQLSNQYNLRVHLETHQNVRYACTVCSHVSRSKDALRKHVSYRHPGTPSPCDPDTKRKRSKANLGQMIKQELLNDQGQMNQLIKQEIMNDQQNMSTQQQQQHHTNQLLANLTSQGNSIVIPSFLQQAASMQSAFSSKSMLFNAPQPISTALAAPPSQMPADVCATLSQPKDLSNNPMLTLDSGANGTSASTSKKLDNGSPERMDEGASVPEEAKPNGAAL